MFIQRKSAQRLLCTFSLKLNCFCYRCAHSVRVLFILIVLWLGGGIFFFVFCFLVTVFCVLVLTALSWNSVLFFFFLNFILTENLCYSVVCLCIYVSLPLTVHCTNAQRVNCILFCTVHTWSSALSQCWHNISSTNLVLRIGKISHVITVSV